MYLGFLLIKEIRKNMPTEEHFHKLKQN